MERAQYALTLANTAGSTVIGGTLGVLLGQCSRLRMEKATATTIAVYIIEQIYVSSTLLATDFLMLLAMKIVVERHAGHLEPC